MKGNKLGQLGVKIGERKGQNKSRLGIGCNEFSIDTDHSSIR